MKIKGHTKIELFDGLTGKLKERIEDDNMFTNAIGKMVNFALSHNYIHGGSYRMNGLRSILDSHLNLVGGLLLFDTALDTDADNFWAPSAAKLTGCGVLSKVNGDANVPLLGSYNSAESTSGALTRSWVWDFATNQANGTIATACLTSKIGGYVGYGAPNIMGSSTPISYSDSNAIIALGNVMDRCRYGKDEETSRMNINLSVTNGAYVDFCIDGDNDLKYMVRFKSDALEILSHKMSPVNFDLFRSASSVQPGTVENYSASLTSPYYFYFYNTHEQVLYFWGASSAQTYCTQGTTITINKFDMQTKTLTMNYDSFTINVSGNFLYNFIVTANGTYLCNQNVSGNIYKHTRGGGSGISAIAITGASSISNATSIGFVLNGYVYFGAMFGSGSSSNERTIIIDPSDDSVRFSLINFVVNMANYQYGRLVPPKDNLQIVFGTGSLMWMTLNGSNIYNLEIAHDSYGSNCNTFAPMHYLATKNVLSSPVLKTSDKTMKVTYTITGEELV